jgi:uncharacterized membrane protein YbhN (UPF0104 family)
MKNVRWRLVGVLLLVIGAVAIAASFVDTWEESQTGGLVPDWLALFVALAFLCCAFVGVAWGWISLFPRTANRVFLARAVYLSQIGKYVPGGIWQPSSQVALARNAGVTLSDAAIAFPVSMITLVAASSTTAGVLLMLPGSPLTPPLRIVAGLGPCALAILHRSWMARVLAMAQRRTRRIPAHATLPTQRQILSAAAWQHVAVAGQALAFYWLIHDLDGQVGIVPATGSFVLAWLVGFLAVPIPAGLGLREAVLLAMLGGVTSGPVIIAATLAHRLVNILCEVMLIVANRIHLAWVGRASPTRASAGSTPL